MNNNYRNYEHEVNNAIDDIDVFEYNYYLNK